MRTPDDVQDELLVMRCQDGDRQALAELVQRWQPRLLRQALKSIPSQQKAILAMFYLDAMPIRQIAEVLALPEGTVKMRLYHARCHLKELLERGKP